MTILIVFVVALVVWLALCAIASTIIKRKYGESQAHCRHADHCPKCNGWRPIPRPLYIQRIDTVASGTGVLILLLMFKAFGGPRLPQTQ
jgi:hypothetical protein